jgi:hypothetical protein
MLEQVLIDNVKTKLIATENRFSHYYTLILNANPNLEPNL